MSSLTAFADDTLVVERRGNIASIVLSRPKALNALNLPMVRSLYRAYAEIAADPQVHSILMTGAGGRAFCAGGDVRAVWDAGRARHAGKTPADDMSDVFFREEYLLNAAIAGPVTPAPHTTIAHWPQTRRRGSSLLRGVRVGCPKPQVSVWNGITMGGGVGLSVHGTFRVATEVLLLSLVRIPIRSLSPMLANKVVTPRLDPMPQNALFAMPETNIGTLASPRLAHCSRKLQ